MCTSRFALPLKRTPETTEVSGKQLENIPEFIDKIANKIFAKSKRPLLLEKSQF